MGIWWRLGNVIKSYLNDGEGAPRGSKGNTGDSDYDAAYEELDDFLKNGREKAKEPIRPIPMEIREAFAELGLSPQAQADECKAAYKNLLKVHHPDRHSGKNADKLKGETEKTARVNAAYKLLEKWFQIKKD